MGKIYVVLVVFILLLISVSAQTQIDVLSISIDSFGGLIESDNLGEIYVGSIISYNLTLINNGTTKIEDLPINILIKNPTNQIIENKSLIIDLEPLESINIRSNVSEKDFSLIYASVSGIYQLILTTNPPFILYDDNRYIRETHYQQLNETLFLKIIEFGGAYRRDYFLPFFFEVKSLQEKRLEEANDELIKRNEEIAKRSEMINRNLLRVTIVLLVATVIMLIVSILFLFKKSKSS